MFHKIFEESRFEIYESQESFIEYVQIEQQKSTKNQKLTVAELIKRMCNRYWCVEEMGDIKRIQSFISTLESFMNVILLQFYK